MQLDETSSRRSPKATTRTTQTTTTDVRRQRSGEPRARRGDPRRCLWRATTRPATAVIDPGDDGNYTVDIEPADFTSTIDNPYLPMPPGSRWRYEETGEDGETEITRSRCSTSTTTVMGVDTIVVHDVVRTEDGDVIEDTYDWYAQDTDGNVWYFGEDTTAYEDGAPAPPALGGRSRRCVARDRDARRARGVRHRLPPGVLPGEAEDMGQVIADSGQ